MGWMEWNGVSGVEVDDGGLIGVDWSDDEMEWSGEEWID